MSSILDALNKKRDRRTTLAGSERSDEAHLQRPRRAGSGASPLRIALWVITTVAVGACTSLFLVYRLAALGLLAKNPIEAPTVAEPGQRPEESPGGLAALPNNGPRAPEINGPAIRGNDLEPVPPAPTRPVGLTWEAQAQAIEPSPAPGERSAMPLEPTPPAEAEAPAEEKAERAQPVPSPEAEEFSLTGLMLNAERPMAIINGRLVAVGERVEGRSVLAISQDGVRLEGQASLLRMHE